MRQQGSHTSIPECTRHRVPADPQPHCIRNTSATIKWLAKLTAFISIPLKLCNYGCSSVIYSWPFIKYSSLPRLTPTLCVETHRVHPGGSTYDVDPTHWTLWPNYSTQGSLVVTLRQKQESFSPFLYFISSYVIPRGLWIDTWPYLRVHSGHNTPGIVPLLFPSPRITVPAARDFAFGNHPDHQSNSAEAILWVAHTLGCGL